jgi:hypothetical protein
LHEIAMQLFVTFRELILKFLTRVMSFRSLRTCRLLFEKRLWINDIRIPPGQLFHALDEMTGAAGAVPAAVPQGDHLYLSVCL